MSHELDLRPAHRMQFFTQRVQFKGLMKIDPESGDQLVSLNGSTWWPKRNGYQTSEIKPHQLPEMNKNIEVKGNGNGSKNIFTASKSELLQVAAD